MSSISKKWKAQCQQECKPDMKEGMFRSSLWGQMMILAQSQLSEETSAPPQTKYYQEAAFQREHWLLVVLFAHCARCLQLNYL